MLSAPTSTPPARRMAATTAASRVAGGREALIFDPASVVSPATSKRFFTAKGSPAGGPGLLGQDAREGVDVRIAGRDARQRDIADLARGGAPGADRGHEREAVGCRVVNPAHGSRGVGWNTGAGSVSSGRASSMTSAAACDTTPRYWTTPGRCAGATGRPQSFAASST